MAISQKPRKLYDPTKLPRRQFLQRAHNCKLYRWQNEGYPINRLDAHGPYPPVENFAIMDRAVNETLPWACVVIAYFMDEAGNYYEEQLSTTPTHPLKLKNEFPTLMRMAYDLAEEAKNAGNAKHYRDTCIALYVSSPALQEKLEDEAFIEKQVLERARQAWGAA